MKRFSFIAALLLCFVTVASAAIRPAQPGIGGGGSSGSLTGTYTFLTPLVLSGSEVQLPAEISNLKTNRAITNASTKDFGVQVDTLYSKNLSLNSRWVYYDDFNENMVTPGLLPDAPTGHKYTLLTQYGNTNHIVQTNGYWSMGNTGAVYRSVHFRTNAQYGSMLYPNSFGGNFRYRKSTNGTVDGVERALTFILSTNADFVGKPPFLHVSVGASGFHVGRELSATNLLYIHPLPGARNLQHLTNYNFSLTIISNVLIAEIAGYKFMTYDESLTTTYAGLNVATWESTGTHTNEAWGEWDSAWAGYSTIGDDMLLGRAFGWETNFGLNKITFTGAGETRYQVKHEADLFQIYDSIAGDVLFSVDDATQETTIGASSAGGVTMPRLVTFPSNNVSGNINAGSVTLASSSAYDGTSWNGDLSVPTKDALRDKIETLGSGGGGGTNFPNVNLLLGGTNLPIVAGIESASHQQTNASYTLNISQSGAFVSGQIVNHSISNSGSSDITVTINTNSVAANPYDIASKTNVNTFTAAASAITKVRLTYTANGLWLLDQVSGPAAVLKFSDGIIRDTNGANGLDITLSTKRLTNYAHATTITINGATDVDMTVTNDLAAGATYTIATPTIGSSGVVRFRPDGSARTVAFQTWPAAIVPLSTNRFSNVTNIDLAASKWAYLNYDIARGTNGTTNCFVWVIQAP